MHLPRLSTPPGEAVETLPVQRALGLKSQLDGYSVPSIQIRLPQASHALATFPIERQGQPLTSVRCASSSAGGPRFTDLACRGNGFELSLKQGDPPRLTGTFKRGEVTLRVEAVVGATTAGGGSPPVVGFDVHRELRWLGAFECAWGGNTYLAGSIGPDEREAVVLVALALTALWEWLAPREPAR